jgi:hypothetical protein
LPSPLPAPKGVPARLGQFGDQPLQPAHGFSSSVAFGPHVRRGLIQTCKGRTSRACRGEWVGGSADRNDARCRTTRAQSACSPVSHQEHQREAHGNRQGHGAKLAAHLLGAKAAERSAVAA